MPAQDRRSDEAKSANECRGGEGPERMHAHEQRHARGRQRDCRRDPIVIGDAGDHGGARRRLSERYRYEPAAERAVPGRAFEALVARPTTKASTDVGVHIASVATTAPAMPAT